MPSSKQIYADHNVSRLIVFVNTFSRDVDKKKKSCGFAGMLIGMEHLIFRTIWIL